MASHARMSAASARRGSFRSQASQVEGRSRCPELSHQAARKLSTDSVPEGWGSPRPAGPAAERSFAAASA